MLGIQSVVHAFYVLQHKQMDPNNLVQAEQKLLLYSKVHFLEMRMVISTLNKL